VSVCECVFVCECVCLCVCVCVFVCVCVCVCGAGGRVLQTSTKNSCPMSYVHSAVAKVSPGVTNWSSINRHKR